MLFLFTLKVLIHTVFLLTCLYFLSAGNLSFFSKLNKGATTEMCDLDEDAPEGKEAKDCKEDGCDEEVFVNLLNTSLLPQSHELTELTFSDPHFFLSKNVLEITSPPPRV